VTPQALIVHSSLRSVIQNGTMTRVVKMGELNYTPGGIVFLVSHGGSGWSERAIVQTCVTKRLGQVDAGEITSAGFASKAELITRLGDGWSNPELSDASIVTVVSFTKAV
jgi:hypothetical protein